MTCLRPLRRVRLDVAALSAFLLAAGVAQAAERLVAPPYPGKPPWREVTNQVAGQSWIREQIPADQTLETYRDILTIQAVPTTPGLSPALVLRGVFARTGQACENVRVNGPFEKVEHGHTVAYAQVYCSRQRGQDFGVNMLFKVIQGDGRTYLINRDFRVPPSDVAGVQAFPKGHEAEAMGAMQALATANEYLAQSVYLCADASTDPRCAAGPAKAR